MSARAILWVFAGLFVASASHAQQTGFYIGAAATASRGSNISADEVNDFLRQARYSNPNTSVDRSDSGYKFFAGYTLNPNVAFELSDSDIGEFSTKTTVTGGSVDARYRAKATSLDALLSAPVSSNTSVFGRIGVAQTKLDASFSSTGIVGLLFNQASRRKTAPHYGVGIQFSPAKDWGIRAELERFAKLGDDSTGGELRTATYSLGLIYRF
jgi:OOP family OmpA-OmpF porin